MKDVNGTLWYTKMMYMYAVCLYSTILCLKSCFWFGDRYFLTFVENHKIVKRCVRGV